MNRGSHHLLLIAVACFVVYGATLAFGFVWDDIWLIVENPQIKRADVISRAFTQEFFGGQGEFLRIPFYRPVVTLLNAGSYALFRLRPFYYHLTNVLLHTLNAILLYGLLVGFLRTSRFAALVAALIFAVHPIHTESVAFISGRTDLLATFFVLLGLWAYLLKFKHPNTSISVFHTISLLIFILGLFAKESFILFPVLLLAFDYYASTARTPREFWQRRICRPDKLKCEADSCASPTAGPCVIFYAGLVAVGVAYLFLRFSVLGGMPLPPYPAGTFFATVLTMTKVFWHYVALTILPLKMMASYENYFAVSRSLLDLKVIFSLLGIAAFAFLLLLSLAKRSRYFLALLWFSLTLLPVMNLFPLGLWLAERFLYLPGIGLSLALGFLVDDFAKMRSLRERKLLAAALILLIILYSAMAISRSTIWRSDKAIWQDAVAKNPENPVALTTLAQSLLPLGQSEQARRLLQKAIALEPDRFYPRRMETYALALINTGDYDAATSVVERLQRRMPDSSMVYQLQAMIARRKGDTERAEQALKESIARNPNSLHGRVALMNLYIRGERNLLDVLRLANEMIGINPDASEGYLYRGVALKKLRETDRAIQAFNQAIARNRRDSEAYFFLANLYEELGEHHPAYLQKALNTYGQLLMHNDRNVSAMLNMGLVYAQLGRYAEAKRLWERILEIDPANTGALHNLELMAKGQQQGELNSSE